MPAILLDAKSLSANLFEGDVMAGLIPTLFADDPAAAEQAMLSDVSKLHWDIGLKDATSLLKKPRYIKTLVNLQPKNV